MKRILFVDDEVELLDSLRARLHRRRREWEMIFVSSGADVFPILEQQPVDLIVSDVRMPGIDGGELLRVLREHWPQTIRIVLSGYAEQAQILRLVSLAHQYVSKPCDASKLENIIERCFHLHDVLSREELRAAAGRIGALPPMPKVYAELQTLLADTNVTTARLAELISRDPAIATKVLQVVNSAFFRLAKPISKIKDAVAYLGFGAIRNLVMSAEVFAQWDHLPTVEGVSVDVLQEHALACAAATASLCHDPTLTDDAWLAGLVHDIGYWVMLSQCPKELGRVIKQARDTDTEMCDMEKQLLGVSHGEIGAYLLGLWGLPYSLVEAVALHHDPMKVTTHSFDLLAMVATAHALLPEPVHSALGFGKVMLTEEQFNAFNPPFSWQEATQRVQQAVQQHRS